MTTPTQRIRAGIDEIDGVPSNADRLSKFGTRHSTPTEFQTLLAGVLKDTAELARLDQAASKKRTAEKTRIRKEWDERGWIDSQTGIGREDQMGATARLKFVNADILKMDKEIVAENEKERAPIAARLMDARTHLQAGFVIFADPVSLLTRKTAAQAESVLRHFQMLAGAGPKHLEAYSIMAAQTDGPEREAMAMAINMRVDQLDRKTRQSLTFSRADNAMMAVGVEWRRIAEVLAITDYVVSQGLLHDKQLQGKKVAATDRIGIGLALKNAEARIGRRLLDDEGNIITEDERD